jgi:hypothetical protein
MFSPTRDQARRFFIEAWDKRARSLPQTPLEHQAADIVSLHPEYHGLLARVEQAVARDWTPEQGEANPFLHLSLHLAIEEQLSIDQPPGIRAAFAALLARHIDRHEALHEVLECLGETIWQAQRSAAPPDGAAYLDCVKRRLSYNDKLPPRG